MSQERLKAFVGLVQGDSALSAAAKQAFESGGGPGGFVALGKSRGYDFTEAEVVAFLRQAAGGKLSDSELESVVGGGGGGSYLPWLANPWVLAGIVAAAIAIPLAIAGDDDDAS